MGDEKLERLLADLVTANRKAVHARLAYAREHFLWEWLGLNNASIPAILPPTKNDGTLEDFVRKALRGTHDRDGASFLLGRQAYRLMQCAFPEEFKMKALLGSLRYVCGTPVAMVSAGHDIVDLGNERVRTKAGTSGILSDWTCMVVARDFWTSDFPRVLTMFRFEAPGAAVA